MTTDNSSRVISAEMLPGLDCTSISRAPAIYSQPSMMTVDRVLSSLNNRDQDQTSSDLEVQSVMCPEVNKAAVNTHQYNNEGKVMELNTVTVSTGHQALPNPPAHQMKQTVQSGGIFPIVLTKAVDYSNSQQPATYSQPSMMTVDRVLSSLNNRDQDQASSDLEVQSVMCPETRNFLPSLCLKSACPSRASPSSKSSKSSYSPLRLQIAMTNTKRGNVLSVTPTSLYNLTVHQLAAQGEITTLEDKFNDECDVNEPDSMGRTPLMWACAHRQVDIVRYLLSNGADPGRESVERETALAFAASVGCVEIVRMLLAETGVEIDKTDWNDGTPLLYAIYNNHPICVRLLLEVGVDMTVQTEGGHTPLSLSIALGYREVQHAIEKHMISLLQM